VSLRSRRTLVIAAVGVVVTAITPVTSASADGADPTATPSAERSIIEHTSGLYRAPGVTSQAVQRMQRQDVLLRTAERIRSRAAGATGAGLSGITIDPDRSLLHLYWHGAVPPTVSNAVSAARARGVTVDVQQAPYTERQLLAEIDRMAAANAAAAPGARYDLQLAPKPDGSGIWAGVSGLPSGALTAAAPRIAALHTSVALQVEAPGNFTFSYRWYDTTPFWGGAYIERGNMACSDAFGVTGNNGAATYLLTAAHCGEGTWQSGGVTDPSVPTTFHNTYGSTIPAGRDTQHDAQLILTPGGAGNSVYWGESINPPNSLGSNSGVTVGGTEDNVVGAFVCNSGSFSGTVCNIQIRLAKVTFSFDQPENGVQNMNNMSLGEKMADSSGIAAANGNGDSGGPIVSLVSNRARAYGVISGMYTGGGWDAPCVGYRPAGRHCSRSVWFGDIRTILGTVGARMNTG
jgi:streptogrisin D